jgi:hypothetical protein
MEFKTKLVASVGDDTEFQVAPPSVDPTTDAPPTAVQASAPTHETPDRDSKPEGAVCGVQVDPLSVDKRISAVVESGLKLSNVPTATHRDAVPQDTL